MTAYIQPTTLAESGERFCITGIELVPNPRFSNRPEIQYTIILVTEEGLYEERLVTFFARQSDGITAHNHNLQQAYLLKDRLPVHNATLSLNRQSKNYSIKLPEIDSGECPCRTLAIITQNIEKALQSMPLDVAVPQRYTIEELRKDLNLQQHILAVGADVKIGRVSEICRGLPARIEDLRKVLAFINQKRNDKGLPFVTEDQIEWQIRAVHA